MNVYQNVFPKEKVYFYVESELGDLICTTEFNRRVCSGFLQHILSHDAINLGRKYKNALECAKRTNDMPAADTVIQGVYALVELITRHALHVEMEPAVYNGDTLVYTWNYEDEITKIIHADYLLMNPEDRAKYKDVYEATTSMDDAIAYPSASNDSVHNPAWRNNMEFRAKCLNHFIGWTMEEFME